MKKVLFATSLLFLLSVSTNAQEYTTAAGIRLGPNSPAIAPGFTIKHFLDERHALEGIVGINNGIGVCALYEWHFPVGQVPQLQWFAGAGAYAAYRYKTAYLGGAGIVGLDYKLADIPLNISVDWKPELNIIESVGFEASGVGFSARFTF